MWCGCGNNLKYNLTNIKSCNLTCVGNSSEICGGAYYFSIYLTSRFDLHYFYKITF